MVHVNIYISFPYLDFEGIKSLVKVMSCISWSHFLHLQEKNEHLSSTAIGYNHPLFQETGGRLNKKDGLTRYGDSHVKDKTS